MKINIGAGLGFILFSTVFFVVVLNFDETIEPNWPWKGMDVESIRIPHLSVKLRNNKEKNISLPVRGELWLWPPGDQGWDLEGAYELVTHDGSKIEAGTVSIPAMGEKAFKIHLTKTTLIHQDTETLKRIFGAGTWHIQLIFNTDRKRGILSYSPRIPFTEKGHVACIHL